ncbi:MAG: hypothetical protein HUU10_00040 [Bacteroidetes bacterium]|nr:hypothetical protein [Bacteroidota bacterium]
MFRLFVLSVFILLISTITLSAQETESPITTTVVPTEVDTLRPQINNGLRIAKEKLGLIDRMLSGVPIPVDTTATGEPIPQKDLRTLIKEADSVLSVLRLRIELLPRDDDYTKANKTEIQQFQSVSKLYLVRSSDAHSPVSKLQDDTDNKLILALRIIQGEDTTTQSLSNQEKLQLARGMVLEADSLLRSSELAIPALDSAQRETDYLRERQIRLTLFIADLKNLTASAGMNSTVATRKLIEPGAPWTFDSKPALTTDPRVNPVKALLEQSLNEYDEVFKTVQKDTMVCQFQVPDSWLGSEKFKGTVISYRSPNDKIILTINQLTASVDSLQFWANIYEASSYGKNQLLGNYTKIPAQRLQSLGGDQSYLAKYHFRDKEVATLFIQKNERIISTFVEYPNGSLTEKEADLINVIMNSVRFKESL